MDSNWWNQALQSYDIGREHRADRENAQAFQDGGYDAVEQTAGRRGDLRTAMTTRRFQDDQRQQAYERMETIAPWARHAIRATRNMDPQRARMFLEQHQQRFLDFGFTPEQVQAGIAGLTSENPEERTQWAETLDQAFQQHQNPEWQLNQGTGQVFAVDPNSGNVQTGGRVEVAPDWQNDGTVPYRITPDGQVVQGSGAIPHRPRAAEIEGDGLSSSDIRAERDLRREFDGRQDGFRQVRDSYAQIRALAEGPPSAAGDLSFIFSYMKMLDPGSVVREGEFANAQNAAGVPDQIRNLYNRVSQGQRLNDAQRADFTNQARSIYETRARQFERDAEEYRGLATDYGFDPSRVVTVQALPQEPGQGTGIGAMVGARGAPRDVLERPNEIPANEWAAMTPQERQRVIQILGRQGGQ